MKKIPRKDHKFSADSPAFNLPVISVLNAYDVKTNAYMHRARVISDTLDCIMNTVEKLPSDERLKAWALDIYNQDKSVQFYIEDSMGYEQRLIYVFPSDNK